MSQAKETSMLFFDACESGKGWNHCKAYCHEDATFSIQAESLQQIEQVKDYCEFMSTLLVPLPDAKYQIQSVAHDGDTAVVYAKFKGTHTGPNGPVAPTNKSINSDYAFIIETQEGKVSHVTKIWNDQMGMKMLGWQ